MEHFAQDTRGGHETATRPAPGTIVCFVLAMVAEVGSVFQRRQEFVRT
jgi:hypothetical protein